MRRASTRISMAALEFAQASPAPHSSWRWMLWPRGIEVSRDELCDAFEQADKPAVISAHVEAGGVTVVSLAETAADGRRKIEHARTNQGAVLRGMLRSQGATVGEQPVLLDIGDGDTVFTTQELAEWTYEHVHTSVGWSIGPGTAGDGGPLRLFLRHPSGRWSPGHPLNNCSSAT